MKKLLLAFALSAVFLSANVTFYVDAGTAVAGAYSSTLTGQITVNLTGAPSSGTQSKVFVGFNMDNTNTLQISLPAGVSGSCAFDDAWPKDANGRTKWKMVGCVDLNTAGTQQYIATADPHLSQWVFAHQEGSQTIQGDLGPGPLTWRNNDLPITGNVWHMADGNGQCQSSGRDVNLFKSNYWIYRNRFNPVWDGMTFIGQGGEGSGNTYGNRPQALETKGNNNFDVEGNFFKGTYIDQTQAQTGYFIVTRNTNQGMTNTYIKSNIFEHGPGLFTINDATYSGFGPKNAGANATVVNNIAWDINQMGPEVGVAPYTHGGDSGRDSFFYQAGGYGNQWAGRSNEGWIFGSGNQMENLYMANNTIPDLRGYMPVWYFAYTSINTGLTIQNNILSLNNSPFLNGMGAREYQSPAISGCPSSGVGYAYLTCVWQKTNITNNVLTSFNIPATGTGSITADGWAGNTILGSGTALTSIWPKYNMNPCNAVFPWHCDLDPEMFRLPANSPYQGIGVDVTQLKADMGWVDNPTAAFDKNNNLFVSWLYNDSTGQACTVDVATTGNLYSSFNRFKLDTGGKKSRNIMIPASNFSGNTNYDVRLNCETAQGALPFLHVRSN